MRVAVPAPHRIRDHQAEGARLRRPPVGGLPCWLLLLRRAAGCWYVAIACAACQIVHGKRRRRMMADIFATVHTMRDMQRKAAL